MSNPSSTMTEIVTTTLRNRTGMAADNVTKNNALLSRLKKKGKIRQVVTGGRTIVQELEYAENGTFQWYSGYEALNISPSDVFSGAEFNYAQAAVAVSMSGLEMLQNAGKQQVIELLGGRVKNAEKTLANNIAVGVYSDGTGSGGRQIGGLQLLVAATNTNTVGGIDASTAIGAFWKNISFSAVTNGGAATTSSNIQSYMNQIYVQLVRGADAPDLIVADNNLWRRYLESLQAIQRITDNNTAEIGFSSLKYMNADVVLDGGFGGGMPANTMYFINSDYMHFRPHADRNFAPIGNDRFAVNQDAMVRLIGFAGNMTVSNRSLQGVLTT